MLKTRLSKLLPDLFGTDGTGYRGSRSCCGSCAVGLGLMQAQFIPPEGIREQIRRVRRATDKPFGVNFILALPHEENLAVCLEEHVPVISFFWGDAARYVERVHAARSSCRLVRWKQLSTPPRKTRVSER